MFSHLACLPCVHRTSAPPCAHAAIARTDWHHHTLPVPRPKVRLWRPVLLRAYASRPRRPYPNMRRTTRARLSRTKVYFVYASQGSLNYLRHSARAAFLALALQYPKGVPAARLVEPPSRLVGRWLGAPGTRPKFQRRTPPQPPWPPQPARPRPPPRLPRPRPPRPVGAAVAQG